MRKQLTLSLRLSQTDYEMLITIQKMLSKKFQMEINTSEIIRTAIVSMYNHYLNEIIESNKKDN